MPHRGAIANRARCHTQARDVRRGHGALCACCLGPQHCPTCGTRSTQHAGLVTCGVSYLYTSRHESSRSARPTSVHLRAPSSPRKLVKLSASGKRARYLPKRDLSTHLPARPEREDTSEISARSHQKRGISTIRARSRRDLTRREGSPRWPGAWPRPHRWRSGPCEMRSRASELGSRDPRAARSHRTEARR